MRTSRIAKETSKVITAASPSHNGNKRQTRSFAASLHTYKADGSPLQKSEYAGENVKQESLSDNDSSLSSLSSTQVLDIEDLPQPNIPARKRKRSTNYSTTTNLKVTSVEAHISHDVSHPMEAENDPLRKVRKARRQPAKQSVNTKGEVEITPPPNWEATYVAMREMRQRVQAPVDTMGCETLAEEHISPRDKRFQTLTALMLSSQTKDTTTALAIRALQTSLPPPGLTLANILNIAPARLNELIFPVGFHNNKTRYIKATALILHNQFNDDIPDTIEGLMSLPGVGPKMAYLCMSAAWGRTEGIGVDVHVHRITNLWGWHKTNSPEETRIALESWLPKEKWHEINHLLVGFGQTVCLPVGRDCEKCEVGEKGLCPSAGKGSKSRKTNKKIKVEVNESKMNDAQAKQNILIKEEHEIVSNGV